MLTADKHVVSLAAMETDQSKGSLIPFDDSGEQDDVCDLTSSNDDENVLSDCKTNGTLEHDNNRRKSKVNKSCKPPKCKQGESGGRIQSTSCVATDLTFEEVPVSVSNKKKIKEIEDALSEEPVNKSKLRSLAMSEGGLVNDGLRKRVWPQVLDLDTEAASPAPSQEELEAHEEYNQVVLDVNRSLKRFPPGIPYDQRVALQDQLTSLILRVITKYPHLRYYQGYHDVAVTFLLVVGETVAFQILEKLSTEHLRDCMEPTMDKTSYLLNYIYPLIQRMNPLLYDYMERAGVGTMFSLPWFLTWYGHSLNRYSDVVRLYDYFLVSPPLFPLYLAATLVVHQQEQIFSQPCDMPCIHSLLSKIPDDLPFETLLMDATLLYDKYPPQSIEAEVSERFQKELNLRRSSTAPVRRRQPRQDRVWRWLEWNRYVPHWVVVPPIPQPRVRYRWLAVTAMVVVLYSYLRMAEALILDSFPIR